MHSNTATDLHCNYNHLNINSKRYQTTFITQLLFLKRLMINPLIDNFIGMNHFQITTGKAHTIMHFQLTNLTDNIAQMFHFKFLKKN